MKFEILIATMYRKDLSFLDDIFLKNNIDAYAILIINQTNEDELLYSDVNNIRVINSFERGTSASRNLAIKNAIGDICLFGDDDLVYDPNFERIILDSFDKYKDASILSFEAKSKKGGIPHTNYPLEGIHNRETLKKIHTIVIAFKKDKLLRTAVFFNDYFSYKGLFSGGGEYVFLMNAYFKQHKIYHVKETIVYHPSESSGKNMASEENIYARAAKINHYYGSFISKIWVLKYVFFLYRNKYILFTDIVIKIKIGLRAIHKYNGLLKQGLIKRQNSL